MTNGRAFGGFLAGWKYAYYQGDNGGIWEACYDFTGKVDFKEVVKPEEVGPGTPIATLKFFNNFRVYYLNKDKLLREYCWDSSKGRYAGAVNLSDMQAAPDSKIGAVRCRNQFRVYFQNDHYQIEEWIYTEKGKKWYSNGTLPGQPLPGTYMAFINPSGEESETPTIRCYFQSAVGSIEEARWEPYTGWTLTKVGEGPPFTPITATVQTIDGAPQIEVYWIDQEYYVVNTSSHVGPSWTSPSRTDSTPVLFDSKLDAKSRITDGKIDVAVWVAQSENQIIHRRFHNGKWEVGREISLSS